MRQDRKSRGELALAAVAGAWAVACVGEALELIAIAAPGGSPPLAAGAGPRDLRRARGLGPTRALDVARLRAAAGPEVDPALLYGVGAQTRAALRGLGQGSARSAPRDPEVESGVELGPWRAAPKR